MCQIRLLKFIKSHIKLTKKVYTGFKQSKRLDHQLWQLEAKITRVAFSHLKENNLILSNNWGVVHAEARNNLRFLSVNTIQTQASHMSCGKDRRAQEPPDEYVNWTKWSRKEVYSTIEMPIHDRTNAQREINFGFLMPIVIGCKLYKFYFKI
jgi:hypothetical protein